MDLYAYIGMEERSDQPQRVGLKQALVPAGLIPLVAMDYHLDRLQHPNVIAQLQDQVNQSGKEIHLARFVCAEDVLVIKPQP